MSWADALLGSLLAARRSHRRATAVDDPGREHAEQLFAQQIPQIGILKAIGARSGRVGRFCRTMTLVIAAVLWTSQG